MTQILRFVGRPFAGFENALDRQQESFREQTGHDVEFQRDHRPLPEIQHDLIEDRGFESTEYDLFLCHSDWIPVLVDGGMLTSIDSYIASDPPQDWPDGWAESMRELISWNGSTYGIPYHDGPEIFHYREDLFENVEEQRRFRNEYDRPLRVPRTWEEFVEVATFFTRPDEDLWGTVVAAKPDGHNDVYDWLIQLRSRGGDVFDEKGNVVFDDEQGKEALRFYHDLIHRYEVAPPESTDFESVESGQFYASGQAAMMWNWSGFGALSTDPESPTFGRTNYGIIPRADHPEGQHTSLTVTYNLTILSNSTNKDLAYKFIKHCARPENDRVTTEEGASGTRLSTWRDPDLLQQNSFYSIVDEINTGSVNYMPRVPQFTQLNDILNDMVDAAVVKRTTSPDEAVDQAASRTRDLLS